MSGRIRTLALLAAACGLCVPGVYAAENAPIGAWRTTSECFLAAFVLTAGGRAQTVYQTGERDDTAAWTWDGSTLTINSPTFDLDRFTGHLRIDRLERLEADYVWHDLDKDELHRQTCVFERFTPSGF